MSSSLCLHDCAMGRRCAVVALLHVCWLTCLHAEAFITSPPLRVLDGYTNLTLWSDLNESDVRNGCFWSHERTGDTLIKTDDPYYNKRYKAGRCDSCNSTSCSTCANCVMFTTVSKALHNSTYLIQDAKSVNILQMFTVLVYKYEDLNVTIQTNGSSMGSPGHFFYDSSGMIKGEPLVLDNITEYIKVTVTMGTNAPPTSHLIGYRSIGEDLNPFNTSCVWKDRTCGVVVPVQPKHSQDLTYNIYVDWKIQGITENVSVVKLIPAEARPPLDAAYQEATDNQLVIIIGCTLGGLGILIALIAGGIVWWRKRQNGRRRRHLSTTDGPGTPNGTELNPLTQDADDHGQNNGQEPHAEPGPQPDLILKDEMEETADLIIEHLKTNRTAITQFINQKEGEYLTKHTKAVLDELPFAPTLRLVVSYRAYRDPKDHDAVVNVLQHLLQDGALSCLKPASSDKTGKRLSRCLGEYFGNHPDRLTVSREVLWFTIHWWVSFSKVNNKFTDLVQGDFEVCQTPLIYSDDDREILINEDKLVGVLSGELQKGVDDMSQWIEMFIMPSWQRDPMFIRAVMRAACSQWKSGPEGETFIRDLASRGYFDDAQVTALLAIQDCSNAEQIIPQLGNYISEGAVCAWVNDPRQKLYDDACCIAKRLSIQLTEPTGEESTEPTTKDEAKITEYCNWLDETKAFSEERFAAVSHFRGCRRRIVEIVCTWVYAEQNPTTPEDAVQIVNQHTISMLGHKLEVLDGLRSSCRAQNGLTDKLLKMVFDETTVTWNDFVLWTNQGRDEGDTLEALMMGKTDLCESWEQALSDLEKDLRNNVDNDSIIEKVNLRVPQKWLSKKDFIDKLCLGILNCSKDIQQGFDLSRLHQRVPLFWQFLKHNHETEVQALRSMDCKLNTNPWMVRVIQTLVWGNAVSLMAVCKYIKFCIDELNKENRNLHDSGYKYKYTDLKNFLASKLRTEERQKKS